MPSIVNPTRDIVGPVLAGLALVVPLAACGANAPPAGTNPSTPASRLSPAPSPAFRVPPFVPTRGTIVAEPFSTWTPDRLATAGAAAATARRAAAPPYPPSVPFPTAVPPAISPLPVPRPPSPAASPGGGGVTRPPARPTTGPVATPTGTVSASANLNPLVVTLFVPPGPIRAATPFTATVELENRDANPFPFGTPCGEYFTLLARTEDGRVVGNSARDRFGPYAVPCAAGEHEFAPGEAILIERRFSVGATGSIRLGVGPFGSSNPWVEIPVTVE